ncbi:hypothetical protein [Aquimarina litoralis]
MKLLAKIDKINIFREATQGAPNATQVTDRWHLLKNLREAITKIMC